MLKLENWIVSKVVKSPWGRDCEEVGLVSACLSTPGTVCARQSPSGLLCSNAFPSGLTDTPASEEFLGLKLTVRIFSQSWFWQKCNRLVSKLKLKCKQYETTLLFSIFLFNWNLISPPSVCYFPILPSKLRVPAWPRLCRPVKKKCQNMTKRGLIVIKESSINDVTQFLTPYCLSFI